MSLDLTALSAYTDENKNSLIAAAVAGARSAEVLNLQTGYKSSGAINILDTDVVFQEDAGGRTPNGTTTLSQRILTVGAVKVEEDIDVKALNKTYQQHNLKAGSKDDVLPFEEEYTELKAKKIAEAVEIAIWQGDTTLPDNAANKNKRRFDGFLKHIDAEAATIDGNPNDITSVQKSTSRQIVGDMYGVFPTAILKEDDLIIACGFDFFRMYIQAIKDANLYHSDGRHSNFEYEVEAGVVLTALHGLDGTNRLAGGRARDFVVGTDLENEEETFEMWYSKDDKCVKFDAAFKYGTQIAFPEQIVEFTVHTP